MPHSGCDCLCSCNDLLGNNFGNYCLLSHRKSFSRRCNILQVEFPFSEFEFDTIDFRPKQTLRNTRQVAFPILNAYQNVNRTGGERVAFITKLNETGNALVYSTFLGGSSGRNIASGIRVDSNGCAHVIGATYASDFPVTSEAFQKEYNEYVGEDGFVTKLNPAGNGLLYSTYLAARGTERLNAIAIGADGSAYITGEYNYVPSQANIGFPTTPGSFRPTPCTITGDTSVSTAFVTKLNSTGSALVYSTYLCGNDYEVARAIALDNNGNAHVTGYTRSADFPVTGAIPSIHHGASDVFVSKFNSAGSALEYSRLFGGTAGETGCALQVDGSGNAYVAGFTNSSDFPTANAFQNQFAGGGPTNYNLDFSGDAFVLKLDPLANILFSTYLGGSKHDGATGIALDREGNIIVVGNTESTDFPQLKPLQPSYGGGWSDTFVAKLNPLADQLAYSTFLGGSKYEVARGMAIDSSGKVIVAGTTWSENFPLANPFRSTTGGITAFVSRIVDESSNGPALFVPIVLSSAGVNHSFFTSELTLTNRGSTAATLDFSYVAAFGEGSGGGQEYLSAGEQRIIPDAIEYLKSLQLPIPSEGARGGTLRIGFSGLNSPLDAGVTVRTTTAVPNGRAGLAYAGIPANSALAGTSYLCGLRQNATDRSNVALQNVGGPDDGNIGLRLTVFSGDSAAPFSKTLDVINLPPGGWTQISGILVSNGMSLSNGYVKIERVTGGARYYAYAVINDQFNSDGSFIPPILESSLVGKSKLTLPVLVETGLFNSELVITNWSSNPKLLQMSFVADGISSTNSTAQFLSVIRAGEQLIIPDFIQSLRDQKIDGIGPRGVIFAGALFVEVSAGDISGISVAARTSSPGGGGRFGLFYAAVPNGMAPSTSTWLYGLQQNSENRTNLALVNTGEVDANPDTFKIEIYDGETGTKSGEVPSFSLKAKGWIQFGTILATYSPGVAHGYAKITRLTGNNPFIAYAVINDGGQPGQRTGDGAYISGAQ